MTTAGSLTARPAESLTGLELDGGWRVTSLCQKKPNATGSSFSVGYQCENKDGRKGFLKALDYSHALMHPDRARILNGLTTAYLFEVELHQKCEQHRVTRVSRCIGSGSVPTSSPTSHAVDYLIFELADSDIRAHLDAMTNADAVFTLRTLHHVATGLKQLHGAKMAHQDLKPSNVLVFGKEVGSKLGDMGRGWCSEVSGPYDNMPFAGDPSYAPIDIVYGAPYPDPVHRRFGTDMYHLGNLIAFLFSRTHINGLLARHVELSHRPRAWAGTYVDVLPYLQVAFEKALDDIEAHVPTSIWPEIRGAIWECCQPDTSRRGHPLNRHEGANPFSFERYLSLFDLLAYRLDIGKKKAIA